MEKQIKVRILILDVKNGSKSFYNQKEPARKKIKILKANINRGKAHYFKEFF